MMTDIRANITVQMVVFVFQTRLLLRKKRLDICFDECNCHDSLQVCSIAFMSPPVMFRLFHF